MCALAKANNSDVLGANNGNGRINLNSKAHCCIAWSLRQSPKDEAERFVALRSRRPILREQWFRLQSSVVDDETYRTMATKAFHEVLNRTIRGYNADDGGVSLISPTE
jgi:hypothetical protein